MPTAHLSQIPEVEGLEHWWLMTSRGAYVKASLWMQKPRAVRNGGHDNRRSWGQAGPAGVMGAVD